MSQSKPGAALEAALEWLKKQRADQPSIKEEMRALGRAGREDAWNALIPAFPGQSYTREAGAPGNPTSQQTTQALEGAEVDPQKDVVMLEVAPPEQQKSVERGR